MRKTLLALALILPVATGAQELRSGPNAPSVGGQLPPQQLQGDRSGLPPSNARPPSNVTEFRADDPARTTPPPGHATMPAPSVPGATQPQRTEGFADTQSPVPARPGARPDASTTGRDGQGPGSATGGGR